MARELEILEAARHPGVVEVLGVDDGPAGPSLRTAPVGGVLLTHLASLTIEEVAGAVAAVASTLADLHDLGLVHGALTAGSILVGRDGRPVLCGFGYGGRAGQTPVGRAGLSDSASDPAEADGAPLHPAGDVFALGVLLRSLADRAVGAAGAPKGLRPRSTGRGVDALHAVADRATVADRHLRPSAAAFAAAVRHAVPGAHLPRRSGTDASLDGKSQDFEARAVRAAGADADDGSSPLDPLLAWRRRRGDRSTTTGARRRPSARRLAMAVGVVVIAASAVSVAFSAISATSRPTRVPSEMAESGWPTSGGSTSPTVPPTRFTTTTLVRPRPAVTVPPGRSCAPVAAGLSADTDGDGCAEAMRWTDGVVDAGKSRWAVGRPGDRVATGDWRCAGTRTLALLRPSTGEVFVLDGWAGAGGELSAPALTVVDGGYALRAGDLDADGCPELLVERPGRDPVQVPTTVVTP